MGRRIQSAADARQPRPFRENLELDRHRAGRRRDGDCAAPACRGRSPLLPHRDENSPAQASQPPPLIPYRDKRQGRRKHPERRVEERACQASASGPKGRRHVHGDFRPTRLTHVAPRKIPAFAAFQIHVCVGTRRAAVRLPCPPQSLNVLSRHMGSFPCEYRRRMAARRLSDVRRPVRPWPREIPFAEPGGSVAQRSSPAAAA
jgi:hypothetical protein